MKKKIIMFTALFMASTAASAFVALPTDGSRVFGSSNLGNDNLFVSDGGLNGSSYLDPVSGAQIFNYNLPSNLIELNRMQTAISLPDEDDSSVFEEVGQFIDVVFRDSTDGYLIFGSRIELEAEEEITGSGIFEWADGEINDIFRSGFDGWSTSVGWTRETSADLRMFNAAHSETSGVDVTDGDPEVLNLDIVGMQSDINGEEGNPFSGWYLIKTDATHYAELADAVGLYQAGEEDQSPYLAQMAGFAPSAVPVPAAVWMFGSALIGLLGIRRKV